MDQDELFIPGDVKLEPSGGNSNPSFPQCYGFSKNDMARSFSLMTVDSGFSEIGDDTQTLDTQDYQWNPEPGSQAYQVYQGYASYPSSSYASPEELFPRSPWIQQPPQPELYQSMGTDPFRSAPTEADPSGFSNIDVDSDATRLCNVQVTGHTLNSPNPEDSPHEAIGTSSNADQYRCPAPDCKGKKPFRRAADLARHRDQLHKPKGDMQPHCCDYRNCDRAIEPFYRKDHCRDHFRVYHREDLMMRAKKPEQEWWDDRLISLKFWRCAKCLQRIQIKKLGWECPTCKLKCEDLRIEARMKKGAEEKKEVGACRNETVAAGMTESEQAAVTASKGKQPSLSISSPSTMGFYSHESSSPQAFASHLETTGQAYGYYLPTTTTTQDWL